MYPYIKWGIHGLLQLHAVNFIDDFGYFRLFKPADYLFFRYSKILYFKINNK